jgi:glycosyltransferase involved in cell wall biosynthesis
MYLSLIIPFYNEEKNLPLLAEKINQFLAGFDKSAEVIFVNDGSRDGGLSVLKQLVADKPDWRVISLRRNFGQTAAWSAGLDHAQGEVIVFLDSDLENDPQDITLLLEKIEAGYDLVSGWRKERWQGQKFTRRFTSEVANWLIAKVSGVKIHDFGCSLKAYRREVIKDVKLYGEMHRFIAVLASWQGAKIVEVEVNFTPRKFGRSHYGLERILKVFLDLIVIKFLSGYSTKPIYFFGQAGFASVAVGLLTFLLAVYYKFWGDKSFIETPLPILTALFLILGVMFILIGLLAEMITRLHHEASNKKIYLIKEKTNFYD